jgi:hypothetical protein
LFFGERSGPRYLSFDYEFRHSVSSLTPIGDGMTRSVMETMRLLIESCSVQRNLQAETGS